VARSPLADQAVQPGGTLSLDFDVSGMGVDDVEVLLDGVPVAHLVDETAAGTVRLPGGLTQGQRPAIQARAYARGGLVATSAERRLRVVAPRPLRRPSPAHCRGARRCPPARPSTWGPPSPAASHR